MIHVSITSLLLSCSLAATTPEASDTTLTMTSRELRTSHGAKIGADAGRLLVPENRAVASSRRIPIRFLWLHARTSHPRAPLFSLAGGPGQRGVVDDPESLDFWSPFLDVCDVVLIDQRGVADPLLRWSWDGPPPLQFFVNADSATAHLVELNRRAAAVVRERGVDITGYTTVESARDLDALRQALGLKRISVFGFSYGTHLAIAYLRAFDANVDDAVIAGVEGPDQTYKLPMTMDGAMERLARRAAAAPEISRRIPDLMALYDRVVAQLDRSPMVVPVPAPGGKDTLRVPVGGFGLRFLLRVDVGDATDLPVFPRLLWSIDQGDPSLLTWFVRKRAGGALGVQAMGIAMDAASGVSPERMAMIQAQSKTSRFADVVNFPFPAVGGPWGMPDLGPQFRSPLHSSVRALILSGSLDFNTPPEQGDELARGMPHATHLVVEGAGHEQTFLQNPDGVRAIVDFLAGGDVSQRKLRYAWPGFVALEGRGGARHPSVP
jgi:pimeloyl-ACP methyl ester carboxylesterase